MTDLRKGHPQKEVKNWQASDLLKGKITDVQKRREERDMQIYIEFEKLAENENNSRVLIARFLADKFGCCVSSIRNACIRVKTKRNLHK